MGDNNTTGGMTTKKIVLVSLSFTLPTYYIDAG